VKFTIGNYKLRIETGRYDQIPQVNRLCPIREFGQIEDASHFPVYCNYSILRFEFYTEKWKISSRILSNYVRYKPAANL